MRVRRCACDVGGMEITSRKVAELERVVRVRVGVDPLERRVRLMRDVRRNQFAEPVEPSRVRLQSDLTI